MRLIQVCGSHGLLVTLGLDLFAGEKTLADLRARLSSHVSDCSHEVVLKRAGLERLLLAVKSATSATSGVLGLNLPLDLVLNPVHICHSVHLLHYVRQNLP